MFLHRRRNVGNHAADIGNRAANALDCRYRIPGGRLNLPDLMGDLVGRPGGLLGEAFDLRRHHCEALAGIARPRCLNRCVQRQQIGLAGDIGDQPDDIADLLRAIRQRLHDRVGPPRIIGSLLGHLRRLHHLAADLADRSGQFLRRARDSVQTARCLLGGRRKKD